MTENTSVKLPEVISVKDLADKLKVPVAKIIGILLKNGVAATINESLDFETAAIICSEYEVSAELDTELTTKISIVSSANAVPRAPVVTIMGHVDHGKTTLLDAIREANVAGGESGGITQHIAAYQVVLRSNKSHRINKITFLDTPGHAAFSAMRQHGASITDIVVLVVAANDGVKAQTIEAIDHAKQARVPIIVAVTKADLPDANIERVKQQLAEVEMVPEDWGGKTIIVPVSAKTNQGMQDLLEMILLVADLAELNATPLGVAVGVVIEAHLEPGRGPVATILVQNGCLSTGQPIAIGATFGKIRTLESFLRQKIDTAGPSDPVIISGLKSVPNFGDRMIVFDTDRAAKTQADASARESSHSKVHSMITKGLDQSVSDELIQKHELPLVIKADVKGSLEAIHKVLDELNTDEVSVKITHEGVGPVSESDVTHAKATGARILSFRSPFAADIRNLANKETVSIYPYDVIYDLTEDVKKALSKLLPPEIVEVPLGRASVIALFKGDKRSQVIGVQVEEGTVSKDDNFHLNAKGRDVIDGKILAVRRGKDEVKQAGSGTQAGLSITGSLIVKVGDTIQCYRTETRARTL